MKLLGNALIILTAAAALFTVDLEAGYVFRGGKLMDDKFAPSMSYLDHYSAGCKAFEGCQWSEAHRHFYIVSNSYKQCPHASEALFYLGICYFNMEEFDLANDTLDAYLSSNNNPQYFETAFGYKFAIAEKFRCGAKRRFCGTRKMPKWACGRELAVKIYNEVVTSLPSHDLAVRSLYAKGWLLWEDYDYKGAVESFQTLVRRFPRNELTPECYILINHVYLEQAEFEFQNPDLLALAEINTQRFIRAFPKEERIAQCQYLFQCIKEVYAKGLYDIGVFYEKTGKNKAAVIYYQNTIARFPDTAVAAAAVQRLFILRPDCYETLIPKAYFEPAPLPTEEALENSADGEALDLDESLDETHEESDDQ